MLKALAESSHAVTALYATPSSNEGGGARNAFGGRLWLRVISTYIAGCCKAVGARPQAIATPTLSTGRNP